MRQLFGNKSPELARHLEAEIGNVLAAGGDIYVGCPTPDCTAFVEATTPGTPERCSCPACGHVFCSRCKGLFHGVPRQAGGVAAPWLELVGEPAGAEAGAAAAEAAGTAGMTCGEAAETARRWHAWRAGGRAAFEARSAADREVGVGRPRPFDRPSHRPARFTTV